MTRETQTLELNKNPMVQRHRGFTIGTMTWMCQEVHAGAFGNPFNTWGTTAWRTKLNFQLRIRMLNSCLGLDCFKEARIPATIRADEFTVTLVTLKGI